MSVFFEDADSAVFRFENTLINLLKIPAARDLVEPGVVASPRAGIDTCLRPSARAAGDRAHDQVRLSPCCDLVGQWGIDRFIRQVLLAGEEPQQRPPPLGGLVADGSAQRRVLRLERIENRALGDRAVDPDLHLATDARERTQVCRQHDPDQASVCTSTDSTDGRSLTIAVQLSPESADAYTWPPVVPKYTPHESSESTAIASRSTFT